MKQPKSKDAVSIPVIPNNLKRSAPTSFHCPGAGTLLAQRPRKELRTEQDDIVSSITRIYERPMSSQAVTTSGPSSWSSITSLEDNHPTMKTIDVNASSLTGYYCFNESGGRENKMKQKVASAVGATMISHHTGRACNKKNSEDIRGQERMSELTDAIQRMDIITSVPIRKPTQGMICDLVKDKSKTGGAFPKKQRNRKASVSSSHHPIDKPSDNTGELDADREDLIAVASSVHSAREHACSGPFWKKMERFFAPVTDEDLLFLKRQLKFTEELNQSTGTPMLTDAREAEDVATTKNSSGKEIVDLDSTDFGGPEANETSNAVPSLFQRVLSALIDEDEGNKESNNFSNEGNINDDFHKEREESEAQPPEEDLQLQKCFPDLDKLSGSGIGSSNTSSAKVASSAFCNDQLPQANGLSSNIAEIAFGSDQDDQNTPPLMSSFNREYQALSVDEKLALELQSIGLSLGEMPLVDNGGESWIDREIKGPERQLYNQQASKVKNSLKEIEAAIQCEQELEKRSIEESAMDQLVHLAYKKIKVIKRPNKSSRTRKVISEQEASAFADRTLARCKQFEDSGKSCFTTERHLKDIILHKPPSTTKKEGRKIAKRKASGAGPTVSGGIQNRADHCRSNKRRRGSSRIRQTLTAPPASAPREEEQELRSSREKEVVEIISLDPDQGQVNPSSSTAEQKKKKPEANLSSRPPKQYVYKPRAKPKMRSLSRIGIQELQKKNSSTQQLCSSSTDQKSSGDHPIAAAPADDGDDEKNKLQSESPANNNNSNNNNNNASDQPLPAAMDAHHDHDHHHDPHRHHHHRMDELDYLAAFDLPDFIDDIDSMLDNIDDDDDVEGSLGDDYFSEGLDVPMDGLSDIQMFFF